MTDIIVIGIIAICLFLILHSYIRKAKSGEATGCCGGCSNCSSKNCSSYDSK